MSDSSSFLPRIDPQAYAGPIEEMLNRVFSHPLSANAQKIELLRLYIEMALARGAAPHPGTLAAMSANDLVEAINSLPDKQGQGWAAITYLEVHDRRAFAAAENERALRWDTLFGESANDLVLPLGEYAQSLEDKVGAFLAAQRKPAKRRYLLARSADRRAVKKNPAARLVAGLSIEQRHIRIDPDPAPGKPPKLQSLNPALPGAVWEAGPRVDQFLQERGEWDLYEVYRAEQKAKDKPAPVALPGAARVSLWDIAHRDPVAADPLFDAGLLRVVISRDPQKIGEMSTGQRWQSCMASDGPNYEYVPKDIACGTLVAYVVHKDDPEARYPLMRQLIKPFHNDEGETVLVPAKIYGGEGSSSSRTRDALERTLNTFVQRQNAGKTGEFRMSEELYPDGQSTTARLEGDWDDASIARAARTYKKGAEQEWQTELLAAMQGPKSPQGEERAAQCRNTIRRLYDVNDTYTGLPRLFYRALRATAIGAVPHPRAIIAAIAGDGEVQEEAKAFQALRQGHIAAWQAHTRMMDWETIETIALAAAITAVPGSEGESVAAAAWGKHSVDSFRLDSCRNALVFSFCESLRREAIEILFTLAPLFREVKKVQCFALISDHVLPGSAEQKRLIEAALKDADRFVELNIKDKAKDLYKIVAKHAERGSMLSRRALRGILKNVEDDWRDLHVVLRHAVSGSREEATAAKRLLESYMSANRRPDIYDLIAQHTPPHSKTRYRLVECIMDCASNAAYGPHERCDLYVQAALHALSDSAQEQRALDKFSAATKIGYHIRTTLKKILEKIKPDRKIYWQVVKDYFGTLGKTDGYDSIRDARLLRETLAPHLAAYPQALPFYEKTGTLILDRLTALEASSEFKLDIAKTIYEQNRALDPMPTALRAQTERARHIMQENLPFVAQTFERPAAVGALCEPAL